MVYFFRSWIQPVILNFLLSWYRSQKMRIMFVSLMVFGRVVFCLHSYLLFTWIVCYVNCLCLLLALDVRCFADDVVLLAPCASALRQYVSITFNTDKTQLICFRKSANDLPNASINSNGVVIQYSDTVLHLGHLLSMVS